MYTPNPGSWCGAQLTFQQRHRGQGAGTSVTEPQLDPAVARGCNYCRSDIPTPWHQVLSDRKWPSIASMVFLDYRWYYWSIEKYRPALIIAMLAVRSQLCSGSTSLL